MKLYLYCLFIYLAAMFLVIGLCDVIKVFADGIKEIRALQKSIDRCRESAGRKELAKR